MVLTSNNKFAGSKKRGLANLNSALGSTLTILCESPNNNLTIIHSASSIASSSLSNVSYGETGYSVGRDDENIILVESN